MKLLFVDEKDWAKKVPYTIHYLAEHLAERGHEVTAIDFDDTWSKKHGLDLVAGRERRPISKVLSGVSVDVISPPFLKIPGLSRLSTLLSHTWELAATLRRNKPDCIITYSLSNAFQTLLLGRWMNVPVLFHSIDMIGPLIPVRQLAGFAEWVERKLIQQSDCVLGLTPALTERAIQLGAKQAQVIPNGVDIDLLRPGLDTAGMRSELGLGDEKVILFVGTLTTHVDLPAFLKHYADMVREDVKLVIVGDDIVTAGRELRVAKETCRQLGIESDVIFTGLKPAAEVPTYINLADICISPFPPSKFSRYNIAMKVFEYMACGKPTVMFDLEGTKSLVPAGQGGVLYASSYREMMGMLDRLLQDSRERIHLGAVGRRLVEQEFSWRKVVEQLERRILKTIDGRSKGHMVDNDGMIDHRISEN